MIKTIYIRALALAALCSANIANAQNTASVPVSPVEAVPAILVAPAAEPAPLAPGFVRILAGTPVSIEISAGISSKTAKIDDWFPIRLAEPIEVGGVVLIPAGATGKGQIVHAAKARALGKPGELILAARLIDCGTTQIDLRSFRFDEQGRNKAGLLLASSVAVGPLAMPLMFLSGGEVVVPVGATALAKVKTTIDVPSGLAAACPAGTAPAVATTPPAAPMAASITTASVAKAPVVAQ